MCGLVGIIAKHQSGFFTKDADIFQQMLYADAIRGWDATGVFGVQRNGNIDIKKQASAAGHFINTKQYEEFSKDIVSKYHFVIGHNRKATHGEKRNADAHPFWDKKEKICLVHNGMISNHKELCDKSTVDSAAVANALANTDNIADVISTLEGAYAFIWYDVEKKRIYFLRNEQRPLYLCETPSTWIIASEESLAYWIAKRNNTTITSSAIFAENVPYFIDMDKKVLFKEEKIEQKKSHFTTPSTIITTPRIQQQIRYLPINRTAPTYDVNQAPDEFFLSDSDFKIPGDVPDCLTRGARVLCNARTYEPVGINGNYKVYLDLINTNKPFMEMIMFLEKAKFEKLDLTSVLEVTIASVVKMEDTYRIFVNDVEEIAKVQVSANDVTVAEAMWFDDRFPMECDVCLDKIKWKDIPHCNTWIENQTVTSIICPKCSGETHSVQ